MSNAVDAFEAAETPEALISTYMDAVAPFGAKGFVAADYQLEDRAQLIMYTSMPEVFGPLDDDSAWWADDPVVAELAAGRLRPFAVEKAWSKALPSAQPRWDALTEAGLHRGWIFPTSKPRCIGGVYLIAGPDGPEQMGRHLPFLHQLAVYLHAYITELDPDANGGVIVRNTLNNRPQSERRRKLSPREISCLRWCAFGKTADDIALIEDLSPHTVREYLRAAMQKLDSSTQAQAVARALKYGIFRL